MSRIDRIEVFSVLLPFRFSFGHALADRKESTNVVVRLRLDDGTTGYGEGVPREYVTGETPEGAFRALTDELAPRLLGRTVDDVDDVPRLIDEAAPRGNAARCALELALLDACGRRFGRSVSAWLSPAPAPTVRYDAVIPFSSPRKLTVIALVVRALGIAQVKIKVGDDLDHDLAALRTLRRLLGSSVDLRVDANCIWQSADEALRALEAMRAYRISAVEQPLPADEIEGLARITAEAPETVILDESLRTPEDAAALVDARACGAFNLRVSKLGGLLPSMRIAEIGRAAGLDLVVGAQVGESGILSAAGRHLASALGSPRYVEGSGGSLLLREDLTAERVLPGRRGIARSFTAAGLGVRVKEDVLDRHRVGAQTLSAEKVSV